MLLLLRGPRLLQRRSRSVSRRDGGGGGGGGSGSGSGLLLLLLLLKLLRRQRRARSLPPSSLPRPRSHALDDGPRRRKPRRDRGGALPSRGCRHGSSARRRGAGEDGGDDGSRRRKRRPSRSLPPAAKRAAALQPGEEALNHAAVVARPGRSNRGRRGSFLRLPPSRGGRRREHVRSPAAPSPAPHQSREPRGVDAPAAAGAATS